MAFVAVVEQSIPITYSAVAMLEHPYTFSASPPATPTVAVRTIAFVADRRKVESFMDRISYRIRLKG
jgi:hypothetical protein